MVRHFLMVGVVITLASLAYLMLDGPEQGTSRAVRVGVIALTDVDRDTLAGLQAGLADYGYVEGRDIVYLVQEPARTIDRLESTIKKLLAQQPDLIYVSSTPATLKVKALTAAQPLPVIFSPVNDPVGAGIVPSLRRPGGMITGIKLPAGDTLRLRWLRDLAPQAKRLYFPYNPLDKSALESLHQIEEVLPALGMELVKAEMATPAEIEAALRQAPDGIDAIFLPRDSSIESQIGQFVALSYQRNLPLSAPSLTQVHRGALYTYGFVHFEFGRQSARLVRQVMMGVSPADIPVEVAENYFAINLATARRIGLRIDEALLRRADIIIRVEADAGDKVR